MLPSCLEPFVLSPTGAPGVKGGQKTQATPLLEADPCLRSTSCTSRIQLQKVLKLRVKNKRKKAARGRKFTSLPESTNQSTAAMQNRLPGEPSVPEKKHLE